MVSGVNFSMSGENLSMSGVNVSMPDANVSGPSLSEPILSIPTQCLSKKSLCLIVNTLIEDLRSAKSRIAELELQTSAENDQVKIPETFDHANTGKLNELNKCYQESSTLNTTKAHERSENDILHCRYCNQLHKRGKNQCPAYGNTCSRCKRLNHFTSTCKTKILTGSYSSNSPSNMELLNLRKSKSEPDSKETKLISNLEQGKASNRDGKRKKDLGSVKSSNKAPLYPDEYRKEKLELLKTRKNIFYKAQYKRSHREDRNGYIWCANHYRWNCDYCCWKSNSNDPHDLTQTRTEDDYVLRFKDVLINVKDQDKMRNCESCSKLCEWKCKHCHNHYCSLYHISINDTHEAQCLQKQKSFRETTS